MKRLVLAIVLGAWAGRAVADEPRDPCEKRRFRGPTVDLDVKNADLHAVFRFIASVADANIVVADEVQGSVTMRLRKVSWELALCTIARSKSLTVSEARRIYTIRR